VLKKWLTFLEESFSSSSFINGVRLLQGKLNHDGKVPLSGFGGACITSFPFTHSERRGECCLPTFKILEVYLRMNSQLLLYLFLLSLAKDDKMTNSWGDLETLPTIVVGKYGHHILYAQKFVWEFKIYKENHGSKITVDHLSAGHWQHKSYLMEKVCLGPTIWFYQWSDYLVEMYT
jgi:hypothetical protein